jgi:phosphoglucomutase
MAGLQRARLGPKIYAESFLGEEHLRGILHQAQTIVDSALAS